MQTGKVVTRLHASFFYGGMCMERRLPSRLLKSHSEWEGGLQPPSAVSP